MRRIKAIKPKPASAIPIDCSLPLPMSRSSIPIKPMSIEEAALQLDDSSYGFLVFRNSSNDRVNVLYRRQDNNLGLITPEF